LAARPQSEKDAHSTAISDALAARPQSEKDAHSTAISDALAARPQSEKDARCAKTERTKALKNLFTSELVVIEETDGKHLVQVWVTPPRPVRLCSIISPTTGEPLVVRVPTRSCRRFLATTLPMPFPPPPFPPPPGPMPVLSPFPWALMPMPFPISADANAFSAPMPMPIQR